MKKIQFSLIDISYAVDKNPQIKLFGRTTDNQQICVIEDFQPYFYVFTKNIEAFTSKVVKVAVEENDREAKVVGTEVVDKKYLGEDKKVVKVFTKHPSDVTIIKNVLKDWEIVEAIYEYDIPFTKRYLIDKQITPLTILEVEGEEVSSKARVPCFKASKITPLSEDEVKLNILSFDIETYSPPGEAFNPAKNPILMIAFYGENFKKVITWKRFKTDEDYIEFVDGEVELIERFKQIIHQQKPDIITGYFSGGFDFPYVISRAKKYDIDLDLNLDHSKIVVGKGKNKTVKLTGIAHVDVFRFIIKILGRPLNVDSYKLDDVAQEVLG